MTTLYETTFPNHAHADEPKPKITNSVLSYLDQADEWIQELKDVQEAVLALSKDKAISPHDLMIFFTKFSREYVYKPYPEWQIRPKTFLSNYLAGISL